MKRTAIILTGTVKPNTILVSQSTPELRAKEYAAVLNHCSLYGLPVHFLENSDFDMESVPELATAVSHALVTVHRFPLSKGFDRGKGYQEFEMIDRFFEKRQPDFSCFLKISGRYLLKNIPHILSAWENCSEQMMVDMHARMRVAITGVFCCETEFYKQNISGLFLSADDSKGRFIEHVLYEELSTDKTLKTALFPLNPELEGISGSYGGSLSRHPMKMKVRNVERKLLSTFGRTEFPIEY
jgi:hypothetical protein